MERQINEPCGFCGRYAQSMRLWKDFYTATDGGIICEANLVCEPCADKARSVDELLTERGLLTTTTKEG
jgi:hypothetical protein